MHKVHESIKSPDLGIIAPYNWLELFSDWVDGKNLPPVLFDDNIIKKAGSSLKARPIVCLTYLDDQCRELCLQIFIDKKQSFKNVFSLFSYPKRMDWINADFFSHIFSLFKFKSMILSPSAIFSEQELQQLELLPTEHRLEIFLRLKKINDLAIKHQLAIALALF